MNIWKFEKFKTVKRKTHRLLTGRFTSEIHSLSISSELLMHFFRSFGIHGHFEVKTKTQYVRSFRSIIFYFYYIDDGLMTHPKDTAWRHTKVSLTFIQLILHNDIAKRPEILWIFFIYSCLLYSFFFSLLHLAQAQGAQERNMIAKKKYIFFDFSVERNQMCWIQWNNSLDVFGVPNVNAI